MGYPTTSQDPVASPAAPATYLPQHHYSFRFVALSPTSLPLDPAYRPSRHVLHYRILRYRCIFRSATLSSDQPSVRSNKSVRRPALLDVFRMPLPTSVRSRSASAPIPRLLSSRGCSVPFRFVLVSPFGFLLLSFYVLYLIRVTLYIRPRLQVDPYPFLFGSPARYAPCLVYHYIIN